MTKQETPPINLLGCFVLMGLGMTLLVIDWVTRLKKFVKHNRREKQG